MAFIRTDHSDYQAEPGFLSRAGNAIARFFVAWIESCSRADQVEALQAKSDAELAALGLRREDIVRHVFRDRLSF